MATPSPAQTNVSGVFNVRDFGATGKREDKATRSIQAAIDACTTSGGAVVYIPPGDYTTGAIQIKNNVNLFILNDSVDVRLEGTTVLHSPLWNVRLNNLLTQSASSASTAFSCGMCACEQPFFAT